MSGLRDGLCRVGTAHQPFVEGGVGGAHPTKLIIKLGYVRLKSDPPGIYKGLDTHHPAIPHEPPSKVPLPYPSASRMVSGEDSSTTGEETAWPVFLE